MVLRCLSILHFFFILVTTDSQTSEEDNVPPPLPQKNRDSDTVSFADDSLRSEIIEDFYQTVSRPMAVKTEHKIVSNSHYELVEIKNREVIFANEEKVTKKSPPTPPPKPIRASKGTSSP